MTNDAQPLAVRDDQPLVLAPTPREVIAEATQQAEALMEVVKAKGLSRKFSKDAKPYLEAGAWEIIIAFNHAAPKVEYVKPIYDDEGGPIVAYEAKVSLIDIRTGAWRGEGISECALDAYPTRGRTGRDKDKAAKSAAQTWALSKAARMAFAWVAELAGFEPTPAHEMEQSSASESEYGTCVVHDEPYFKSGRMKTPAHKLNGGWCNKSLTAPESPAEPVSEARGTQWSNVNQCSDCGETWTGAHTCESAEGESESDGGPAFFPSEQASEAGAQSRKIANAGAFRQALADDFGLKNMPEIEAALEAASLNPFKQVGNFNDAIEALYIHRQAEPIANTEAT